MDRKGGGRQHERRSSPSKERPRRKDVQAAAFLALYSGTAQAHHEDLLERRKRMAIGSLGLWALDEDVLLYIRPAGRMPDWVDRPDW